MKWIKWVIIFFLFCATALFLIGFIVHEKEPQGMATREADQMAEKMMEAINFSAWDSTRYLTWNFIGRNKYIWDKELNKVKASFGEYQVVLNPDDQSGTAKKNDQLLSGKELSKALMMAYSNFCNDGFWFNAPAKIFDKGTSRSLVTLKDGREGLKIAYDSGGVTPGDAYVWILDDDGLPTSFKMWVKIIPIGGLEFTWDDWTTLSTGAKISTKHTIRNFDLIISDVKGGNSLAEIGISDDPFSL